MDRWIHYDYIQGNDTYKYSLILDTETGLLWVDGDQYKYSFVSKKKGDISLTFEDSRLNWRLPYFYELRDVALEHSFPLHADGNSHHCLYPKISEGRDKDRCGYFPFWCKNNKKDIVVANLDKDVITIVKDRNDCENLVIAVTDEFKLQAENYTLIDNFIKDCHLTCQRSFWTLIQLKKEKQKIRALNICHLIWKKLGTIDPYFHISCEMDYKIYYDKCEDLFYAGGNISTLQYYRKIQKWINWLIGNVFDKKISENNDAISNYANTSLKIKAKWKDNDNFTEEENNFMRKRQNMFSKKFDLNINGTREQLLNIKRQANEKEMQIDDINNNLDSLQKLYEVKNENHVDYAFVVENTTNIVEKCIDRINLFSGNQDYITWALETLNEWNENYKIFKITYIDELISSCKNDEIEDQYYLNWVDKWQDIRFKIEEKFEPIILKEMNKNIDFDSNSDSDVKISQRLIASLETYKKDIDLFFLDERKSIYQKFAFQNNGDVQEKLEAESKLYELTAKLQKSLRDIIFDCSNSEDRIYILKWAGDLLDIQIDEVLDTMLNDDIKEQSGMILSEFAELKKKNYDIYLADAKTFADAQAERDKQFNSLLFKMRKGLK